MASTRSVTEITNHILQQAWPDSFLPVSSPRGYVISLAGTEVLDGLRGVERQKRLRPSQMHPIRERHYRQLVERRMEVPPWNKEWAARLYSLVDIALVGFGKDGMLRGTELCTALKSDLVEMGGGAGRLYIPYSKTDLDGDGAHVYISERSMKDVARVWDAMVSAGIWDEHEERIFPMRRIWISQRIKDAAARLGLAGEYGSHSLRIGMAQDLALGTALEAAGGCLRPARLIDVDHQEAAPGDSKPLGHRESRPAGCAIFQLQCLPSILKYWSGRVRPPG